MVRQWQNLFYGKRYSHTALNDAVDFVKLAEAMGAKAYRVTRQEDLKAGSGGGYCAYRLRYSLSARSTVTTRYTRWYHRSRSRMHLMTPI